LNDPDIILGAIDHCLEIKSFLCIEFILAQLAEQKIEPVIGIQALSEIIQEICNYNYSNYMQATSNNQISLSVKVSELKYISSNNL